MTNRYNQLAETACRRVIACTGYKGEFSEVGRRAALFMDRMWGVHHLNTAKLKKVDWSNDYWVEMVYDRQLTTVDGDDLTKLVILAHQMLLRVSVEGAAYRTNLRLVFHLRKNRDGNFADRCPHISDVVDLYTGRYSEIDNEVTP
ncbi:MAG: hypothetical protein KDD89_06505 [Anaerolineales bacterium]|nr:hypothetical protein [Anaerolineales bacterium]